MNRHQQKAWFTLVGFAVNAAAAGVIAALLPTDDPANVEFLGLGIYQIQAYGLWLGVFAAVIAVGDYLFRKRRGDILDERDRQICQNATVAATEVFWIAFGVACAALVLVFGPLQISFPAVWVVGPLVIGGLVIFWGAYSISILYQYGRQGDRHE
jgi:uncharacterized membrane protein